MHLSTAVLGATAVRALETRTAAPVLTIGSDRFTRADLAAIGCFNYHAAAALSATLDGIGVRDTRAVFLKVPPADVIGPGIGPVALAVLGAAFEARGLGGDQPLETWIQRHATAESGPIVTLHTMKARAKKRTREKKTK